MFNSIFDKFVVNRVTQFTILIYKNSTSRIDVRFRNGKENVRFSFGFSDRRIEMRQENKLIECFAFHTVCQRENALNIGKNGLTCQQLAFNIDKFLGDPKDGIHLSRRPDLLLRFCHSKGLKFIGLVVFKVRRFVLRRSNVFV